MANSMDCTKFWVPPESYVSIPVETRTQVLPVEKLPWDCFQRLCARLAQRCGDVEFSQEYGLPGQEQQGIDIYIRRRESSLYAVWQCKRYQKFSPGLIDKAVTKFLGGTWASRTDEFGLAASVRTEETRLAEAIEVQAKRLSARSIRFVPLGVTQVSERLKDHPDLVDDFFGHEWVRAFCGEDAVSGLSHRRLKPNQIIQLRQQLRRCYSEHFEIVDPGLPSLTGSVRPNVQPLRLADRFVPPDILEEELRPHDELVTTQPTDQSIQPSMVDGSEKPTTSRSGRAMVRTSTVRHPAVEWLSNSDLSVLLGDPGIGKSTLLRCILLDLLSEQPRHASCARRWGRYLPVWVPFAMWTRLVGDSESACSLSDVLTTWLRKVSAGEGLTALVQDALEDSRLLLFVDGLDEWSDETAARTALALFEQFVAERNIPAIATSRPLGYRRIGGLSPKWRKARLAGMTEAQQRIVAERWFLHRSNTIAVEDETPELRHTRESRAIAEAAEHTRDLHRDGRLAQLAEIPLLLNGLIALAIQRVRLPRSRFKAYEELTRLLMDEQPKRREKAAYAPRSTSHLSQETRERAFALLAWETHKSSGSDALEKTVANEVFREFCKSYLCKSPSDAADIADQLLRAGAESVGILLEKSPEDIGFPHRAFQEFLAAKHLSNLPFDEQKTFLRERFGDPQWHDVFLCLCNLNTRAGEADEFVNIVNDLPLSLEVELARQSFLAEVAFGDLHCSPMTAQRVAEETFEIIETGVRETNRDRLVVLALDGLESDTLRSVVQSRIQRWYPLRHRYRAGFYEALQQWPHDSRTQTVLWRGVLDEEDWNQRPAAEALAQCFGGNHDVAIRLFELLFKPTEPRLMAVAVHALCIGWATEPRVSRLLADLRFSADEAVRSVAVTHRVNRNEYDSQDRELIVELSGARRFADWLWRQDRIRALLKGWPNDAEIKRRAILSLSEPEYSSTDFDREDAGQILIEGFPGDPEVASAFANVFKTRKHVSPVFRLQGGWRPLVEAFSGHENLEHAVDGWLARRLDEEKTALFWDYQLCLLLPSPRGKQYLLEPSDQNGVITEYQARFLLQGWGMQDEQAASALRSFAQTEEARHAADILPDILGERKACWDRLLEMFCEQRDLIAQRALAGLVKLGADESDEDVVEMAVAKYKGQVPSGLAAAGITDLILHFSKHPKVREIAVHQIRTGGGDLNTVAKVYAADEDIRRSLCEVCVPLPTELRSVIVERLTRLALEDVFAHELLSSYDQEADTNVKTAAAIGYAKSAIQREQVSPSFLKQLEVGLQVVGPNFRERRQAALSVLLEIDRLDIVKSICSLEDIKMTLSENFGPNLNLAAQLGYHSERVHKAFGDALWDESGRVQDIFLAEVASFATDGQLLDKILSRLETSHQGDVETVPMMQLAAREWRGTERLRNFCMTQIRNFHVTNWFGTAPGIVAAETLAEQFKGDPDTLTLLESLPTNNCSPDALIIALSSGWPGSSVPTIIQKGDVSELLLPTQVYLLAATASAAQFLAELANIMSNIRGDIWEFLPSCGRAVASRFARDAEVCNLAFNRLEAAPRSCEKVNFPNFLLRAHEQRERLRTWMRSEIERQNEGLGLAEIAVDLSTGTLRSVGHVLLEHMLA